MFNYGFLPQTWEDPALNMTELPGGGAAAGDNDPLDVMELGSKAFPVGSVVQVRSSCARGRLSRSNRSVRGSGQAAGTPQGSLACRGSISNQFQVKVDCLSTEGQQRSIAGPVPPAEVPVYLPSKGAVDSPGQQ